MLKELFEHFDSYENIPVEVDTVRDQILELGIQDEINFYFVDIDKGVLRGLLYRYKKRRVVYGDPILCSDILIAESMSVDWQRLVAVKELLHITDSEIHSAESQQAVEKLIECLSRPIELRDFGKETNSSLNDKIQYITALAILVPKECRKILKELSDEGKITNAEIGQMARIPVRYASYVVLPEFEEFVETILEHNTI